MDKVSGKLTVFFEEPFGMGVFERVRLRLTRNQKIMRFYDFVLKNYYWLRFSPSVATDVKEAGHNLKRAQHEAREQV